MAIHCLLERENEKSPSGGPLKDTLKDLWQFVSTSNFRQKGKKSNGPSSFSLLAVCTAGWEMLKKECRLLSLSFLLSVVTSWTQFPGIVRLFSYLFLLVLSYPDLPPTFLPTLPAFLDVIRIVQHVNQVHTTQSTTTTTTLGKWKYIRQFYQYINL